MMEEMLNDMTLAEILAKFHDHVHTHQLAYWLAGEDVHGIPAPAVRDTTLKQAYVFVSQDTAASILYPLAESLVLSLPPQSLLQKHEPVLRGSFECLAMTRHGFTMRAIRTYCLTLDTDIIRFDIYYQSGVVA